MKACNQYFIHCQNKPKQPVFFNSLANISEFKKMLFTNFEVGLVDNLLLFYDNYMLKDDDSMSIIALGSTIKVVTFN